MFHLKTKTFLFDFVIQSLEFIIWATSWQNQQNDCASSKDSDQSDSSQCTQWVAEDPMFLHADSQDTDLKGQMPRLIWVFAGYTCYFVGFVMRRFSYFKMLCCSNFCIIMPPTSKLTGHIDYGLCVHPSVHQEPCMLGFWNFIYGFFMEK